MRIVIGSRPDWPASLEAAKMVGDKLRKAGHEPMEVPREPDVVPDHLQGAGPAHLPDSTLIAQPVGSVRRVVTASPGWLRHHGSPRHPGNLANLNCLIGAEGGRWTFVEGNRSVAVFIGRCADRRRASRRNAA